MPSCYLKDGFFEGPLPRLNNDKEKYRMKYKNPREVPPVEVFFSFVGGRLKGAIIWYLAQEPGRSMRFSELAKCLPKTNPKLLTQQLRTMEQDGLIKRTAYSEMPPRVEYSLTETGLSTYPVLQGAHLWAINYVKGLSPEEAPVTEDARPVYCGSPFAEKAENDPDDGAVSVIEDDTAKGDMSE